MVIQARVTLQFTTVHACRILPSWPGAAVVGAVFVRECPCCVGPRARVTETLIGRPASLEWREFARVIMVRRDRGDVWCRHRRDAVTRIGRREWARTLRRQSYGRLRRLFGL